MDLWVDWAWDFGIVYVSGGFGFGSTLGGPMDTGTVRLGLDRDRSRRVPEQFPSDSRQLEFRDAELGQSVLERWFTIFWEQFSGKIARDDPWGTALED